MTAHFFIATFRPIPEYHKEGKENSYLSGEAYKACLPFNFPYVYEIRGIDKDFLVFIDEFMDIGDVLELYIYEEGRHGISLSSYYPEENRTINLLKKTYKDQFGEYHLNPKNWIQDLIHRTLASKRSIVKFVKY